MTRRLGEQITVCLALLALSAESRAQDSGVSSRAGAESGAKVGEDMLVHGGVGAELGYDSNVFYDEYDPRSSLLLRVTPSIELTNAMRGGAVPPGAFFDLSASLAYREYLSDDAEIAAQRAFNPTVAGSLVVHNGQILSFMISEAFSRINDTPYGGGMGEIIHDNNHLVVQLRYVPGGGRISALLQYTNDLNLFETRDLESKDFLSQEGALELGWRMLPKTSVFVRYEQGNVFYFTSGSSSSFPLHVLAGLRGLVTEKLSLSASAGYSNAFYSFGATTEGLRGNLSAGLELAYRPGPTTSMKLGYSHDFHNSIVGNFYYGDTVSAQVNQQIAGRVNVGLMGGYAYRDYQGVKDLTTEAMDTTTSRQDNVLSLGASADYSIRNGFYTGVSYGLALDSSDYSIPLVTGGSQGVSYVKHLVFLRLGVGF